MTGYKVYNWNQVRRHLLVESHILVHHRLGFEHSEDLLRGRFAAFVEHRLGFIGTK